MAEPAWDTPARLDGLPCTNWKRRTGVTMDGTVAQCVMRWLSLADHDKQNCTMRWGPTADQKHGSWGHLALGAFVQAKGFPPEMARERGGQPPAEVLATLTSVQRYDPCPHASHPSKGAHGGKR